MILRLAPLAIGFLVGIALPQEPPLQPLTLREAIDVAAEYNIRHIAVPETVPFYGLTDFDHRDIFIIEGIDLAQRRKVAIHEFMHVAERMRGHEQPSDEAIQAEADRMYSQLFGDSK